MSKSPTLNRFPLLGLFAYRAAKKLAYPDEDARLLGFSTALLYAIFKLKAEAKKDKFTIEVTKEVPEKIKKIETANIDFGGQSFTVIPGKGKRIKQTVVGHEVHNPDEYDSQIEAKFPEGWYDRLANAFDKYLEGYEPEELNHLFDLYKVWRDENKVGFNRVNLEKLLGWLKEHAKR